MASYKKGSRRRRNLDRDLEIWIRDKVGFEWTPTEIYKQMLIEERFAEKDNLPVLRTVQRFVEDLKGRDATAPWTIGSINVDIENISLEDARIILDVLKVVYYLSRGRKRYFTIKEAQWVLRIAKLTECSPSEIWRKAQDPIYREAKGISTEDLDLYIGLKPWASGVDFKGWSYALFNWNLLGDLKRVKSVEDIDKETIEGFWEGFDIVNELKAYSFPEDIPLPPFSIGEIGELLGLEGLENHYNMQLEIHEKLKTTEGQTKEENNERTHNQEGKE